MSTVAVAGPVAFSALRITDSSPREKVHLGILEHSSERSNAELDDCDEDCTMDRKVVEEYFQSTGKPNVGQSKRRQEQRSEGTEIRPATVRLAFVKCK